jgi:hypothetical protein
VSDETPIVVEVLAQKLEALQNYAKSHKDEFCALTGKRYPQSDAELAEQMSEQGRRTIRAQNLSKAKSTEGENRPLTMREHKLLLKAYGIEWPCMTYYDVERLGRDSNADGFRQWLGRKDVPIRLRVISHRTNMPLFADRELFVLNLKDQSEGLDYVGLLEVKPAEKKITIEGEGLFDGSCIATYGLNDFTVRISCSDGVMLRGVLVAAQEGAGHVVRDRSAPDDFAVLIQSSLRTTEGAVQYLDGEFDVASIAVTEMEPNDTITLEATALVPSINPHVPPEVQSQSLLSAEQLRTRIQRIVQAKIVEQYKDAPSAGNTTSSGFVLAHVQLKRSHLQ